MKEVKRTSSLLYNSLFRLTYCQSHILFFSFLILLFLFVEPAEAYQGGKFKDVCQKTFGYLDGGFAGLLSAVTGVGAIIAAATGGFRAAWGLIVVSIGAFILKEYLDLWFQGSC